MKWPWREVIGDPGDPLLVRYTLLWTPWVRVYIHKLCRSDRDRHLHDHPWSFVSVVLWSGYHEMRPGNEVVERGPLSIAYRRAEDQHRVRLRQLMRVEYHGTTQTWHRVGEIPAWTLVICGRKRRLWGFETEEGWVESSQYFHREG